ncbi:hypothetical protein QTO34_006801 [Cnephaeus nilssonii]|uniref:B(0,+)-type amino acid transporter 1 n=1 Tax=Cnephaeus nilssonii TaxID=3371016 RepID=A0AA40HM37_CNENI|nr:hypothetical protein QTO34_006801 [Eptesicus nilssonii]
MERSGERGGGEQVAGQERGAGGLRLRREIGLWSGVSLIIGSMVGSGIFMSPQGILVYVGSPGASLVVWVVCGLLATLSALCFAELGALVPESGGEYAYILHTLAPCQPSWSSTRGAQEHGCHLHPALLLVNCWSSKLATQLNDVCTVAKVFSLLVIVVGGVVVLGQGRGRTEALLSAFHNTTQQTGRISMAFYQGLWCFDGWNTLNYVLEELKNPQQNLVWALVIAIPLVTGLYLLVNISYLLVLSPNEILSTDAMAVSWGNQVLGAWAWLVPLAVALSHLALPTGRSSAGAVCATWLQEKATCLVTPGEPQTHIGKPWELGTVRLGTLVSRPRLLSMVHTRRLTPTPALVFTTAVTLVLVIPGNFSNIVNFFRQLPCLGHLRSYHQLSPVPADEEEEPTPPLQGPHRHPRRGAPCFSLPGAGTHHDHPQIEFLYIFLFLLSGFLVYFLFVYFQHQPQCLQTATLHLQLLLEVAPATKNVD